MDFGLYRWGEDPTLVLQRETIYSSRIFFACESITVGPDLTVSPSAELYLQAGSSIVFGSGFVVETGARLSALTDPAYACP